MKNNTNAKLSKNTKQKSKANSKIVQVIKKNRKVIIALVLVCLFIYVFGIVLKLFRNPTNTFMVEQGKIYQEESATGYIIREETIVKGENYKNGMSQIKTEGEKVAKGEAIFRYYSNGENNLVKKIEELDKKIDEAMSKEKDLVPSGDIKVLENQIMGKIDSSYNESDLQKIKENKKEINTYITKKAKIAGELSPSGSYLKKLINERSSYENALNSGAEYLKSPVSGVVSYRVDGFEEILNTTDLGNITTDFLESLNLKTGQIIATNDESGKVINNYECYIAVVLDSEYAKQAEVGKSVKLRLPSGNEVNADIEYINMQDEENCVITFRIEKCVEELISYRKISLSVIWWSESGKKIPNTAIQYEEKGENKVAYVIRTRAGYEDKIWLKELRTNGKYTIVDNYTSEELEELGFSSEEIDSRKKVNLYDEILINL